MSETVDITKILAEKPVKTKSDAIAALELATRLKEEAEAQMLELGITEMLDNAEALKKKATKYAASKNIDQLDLPDGRYGRVITATQERVWVGSKGDMPEDAPEGTKPLRTLVSKEVWLKLTKRIPDPEKIDEAVSEGLVKHDEIAPAYFEKMKAPYIRVFGGSDD